MIDYKTPDEIEIMKQGGHILKTVLFEVMDAVKVGVSEREIDELAEKRIIEMGGEPGFKKVRGYNYTVCMSTNDVVVHGIPGDYKFKEGDLVGVDCGVFYKGYHTDMSHSKYLKTQNSELKTNEEKEIEAFLETGKHALNEAIKVAKIGNHIGHISEKIQNLVEGKGYSVVRSLIGHGVGRELHEDPEVPGYKVDRAEKTPLIKEGLTIAIEIIYNMGKHNVVLDSDGWTIRTEDGKLGGLFERTIACTKSGPIILT